MARRKAAQARLAAEQDARRAQAEAERPARIARLAADSGHLQARAAEELAKAEAKAAAYQRRAAEKAAAHPGKRPEGRPPVAPGQHRDVRAARDAAARAARKLEQALAAPVPEPGQPPKIGVTDPASRVMPAKGGGFGQLYNVQALACRGQVIFAVGTHDSPTDAQAIIEPVFAQLFARFGRTLNYRGDHAQTELHLWAAVHNMLKAIRARARAGHRQPLPAARTALAAS